MMTLTMMAEEMIQFYPKYKYSSFATVYGFPLYWNEAKKLMSDYQRVFGVNSFYESFKAFVTLCERDHSWKRPIIRLPETTDTEKLLVLAKAEPNRLLLRDKFLKNINDTLAKEVYPLLYDNPLIVESADAYIEHFNPEIAFGDMEHATLEHFLDYYDVTTKRLLRKPEQSYRWLKVRLSREIQLLNEQKKQQDGEQEDGKQEESWEDIYANRLRKQEPELAQRLQGIKKDLLEHNKEHQERLKMVEFLLEHGAVGIINRFGSDAYDILQALYGEDVFPTEKRYYLHSSHVIRPYLSICRKQRPKFSDFWVTDILKAVTETQFPVELYDQNIVVQRLLQQAALEPLLKKYAAGEDVLETLPASEDPLQEQLIEYIKNHFELIGKINSYREIKHSLKIVHCV